MLKNYHKGDTQLSLKGHTMCFVAFVIFFVTLVVENQMHGFLMVFNKSFASEKNEALKYKLEKDLTLIWQILNSQWFFAVLFVGKCKKVH